MLLSVELCSLTLQPEDLSIPNLIASGLFGDGAAAVVVVGDERPADGPRIVATRSIFYPDSERVMGWDISESGFQIVLSAEVPQVVRDHLRADVDAFLADQGLGRGDIATWISHPGGPKVLEAMAEALELPEGGARRHLAEPPGGRQPLLDLGPPGPPRHPRLPPPARRQLRPDLRHGPRLLLRAGAAAVVSEQSVKRRSSERGSRYGI